VDPFFPILIQRVRLARIVPASQDAYTHEFKPYEAVQIRRSSLVHFSGQAEGFPLTRVLPAVSRVNTPRNSFSSRRAYALAYPCQTLE
jgi:hypothetical protein